MKGKFLKLNHSSVEMVSGSLWKNIFIFSVPLMLSQVLQVLFNMADVAVVGKFASAAALGSVGCTSTLVCLFTGFLIGLGSGVNVIVARHIGAGKKNETVETVHTAFLICLFAGFIIMVACLIFAKPMLKLLNTKDDLMDGACLYFRIYALGMPALGIFNFGNAVLSSAGDTRRPLYYLTAAGIINLVLNLFFVIVCSMTVDGVALASIISQYASAILIIMYMRSKTDECAFRFSKLRIYKGRSKMILSLGIAAGFQNAIFSIANLFIQGGVNSFDTVVVEGNAAASNADTIIYNVMAAFYTACSTFMGQNLGAGNSKRAIKTYYICIAYSCIAGTVLGLCVAFWGDIFLSLFTNEAEVVAAGMERLRIMGFSFGISAFMDSSIAASRGIGKSFGPTIIVILGSCVFRVIWVYTIFAYFHTITSLYLLYAFSWTITSVAEIIYFVINYRRLVNRSEYVKNIYA